MLHKILPICTCKIRSCYALPLRSMCRSRNFRQGGSRSVWQKKLWRFFFVFFHNLFHRSQMVNFREVYHFQGSRGGSTFSGDPYNLWFSRGVRTPCPPPLDPHLRSRCIYKKIQLVFDLGKVTQDVAQYPLCICKDLCCYLQQFRRCIHKKIQYLTFDIDQYPLHYATNAHAKFEIATSNGLGGIAFTRKFIIWPLGSRSCEM